MSTPALAPLSLALHRNRAKHKDLNPPFSLPGEATITPVLSLAKANED
jgi:hypothetical protein